MIGLDSNILLRWIIDDPSAPAQSELVRTRLERETGPLFVNHLVLAETVWVLRHAGSLPPEGLAEVVSGLIDAPNIKLQQPEIVERALASFMKNPGGFADHLIGEINRHAGCTTTLTFDRAAARSPAFTGLQ
jgi:predicted nucleic-acid-binding protein